MAVLREPNTRHMEALLGPKLLLHDGEVSTGDHLRGKVVGLYFSAHW